MKQASQAPRLQRGGAAFFMRCACILELNRFQFQFQQTEADADGRLTVDVAISRPGTIQTGAIQIGLASDSMNTATPPTPPQATNAGIVNAAEV